MLLRPIARVLARLDGDGARFLNDVGIDASTPDDTYIDAAIADRVLAELASERGDPCFGLTLSLSAVEQPFGFFDHLVWPGATLRDALSRHARFYGLITRRSTMQLDERDSVATLSQLVAAGAPRGVVLTEAAFATTVLRAQTAAGGLDVRSMRFAHAVSAEARPQYDRVFGVKVQFGQQVDMLELDSQQLDRPLGTADPVAAAALEARALKMRATLEPSDPFVDELRAVLRKHLAVTDISLATVAGALGLSEQALQRRLDELDVSFRGLVDSVRKDVAIDLLERGISSAEIAAVLGFAQTPAFDKAFVRWTGMTPGSFRVRQE